MRPFRFFRGITLAGLVFYAALAEVFRPHPNPVGHAAMPSSSSFKLIVKTAVFAFVACIVLEAIGGLLFMASGFYNIAADQPHFGPIRWFLKTASTRSARFHTEPERVPNLRDASLVKQGLALCRKNCQPCHGAPGVASDQLGRGINPKPPRLAIMGDDWNDLELYWILSHGLKMSGMPAFGARLSETDRWAIVAFLRRVVLLSPIEYGQLTAAADRGIDDPRVAWLPDNDAGFHDLQTKGSAARGRELLGSYGCGTCHLIPGVGSGSVGPPLSNFAERQYIAGVLVNAPANLVPWIANPKRFKPATAMPNVGVQPSEAVHMAAYLYTLGSPKRMVTLKRAAGGNPVFAGGG